MSAYYLTQQYIVVSADVSISFTTQQWKVMTLAYIIYHTTMESSDVSISFTTQQWKMLLFSDGIMLMSAIFVHTYIAFHGA